ncbi:MAG: DUF2219 family protein [Gemmatimonadetes bacterium]|nr:DUF2219 family protein [Gemmatimonadota bacterium]
MAQYQPDPQTERRYSEASKDAEGSAFTLGATFPLRSLGVPQVGGTAGAPALPLFGFVLENDLPWLDQGYTNGLRVVVSEVPGVRRVLRLAHLGFARGAPACPYRGLVTMVASSCRTTMVSLSQTMHTPTSIYERDRQLDDRPFAGTLFLAGRSDIIHPSDAQNRFWSIGSEAQVGVLGPASGAAGAQRMAHWLISTASSRPDGWDRQLTNRWHAAVLVDGALRIAETRATQDPDHRGLSADLTARGSTTLGRTHAGAAAGIVGRFSPFGTTLPLTQIRAIAPAFRRLSALSRDTIDATPRPRVAVVAGADVRSVWRNATLSERPITLNPRLLELSGGLQLELRSVMASALVIHRGREYERRGDPQSRFARYFTLQLMYRPS